MTGTRPILLGALAALAVTAGAAAKRPNMVPQWTGAEVGVWTMDYESALSSAKAEGKWTIMLFTGAWWCPWCQPLEEKVLDTDAWRAYAAAKGFYEIEIDNPNRAVDVFGNPCWLWDADYLAAAGLTAQEGMDEVIDRFKSVQDKYALPGAQRQTVSVPGYRTFTYKRIGYPTALMFAPDGTLVGRFSPDVRDYPDKGIEWTKEAAFAEVTNLVEQTMRSRVTVSLDPACVDMGKVNTYSNEYCAENAKITLKATANKGFAFAGWYLREGDALVEPKWTTDYRQASQTWTKDAGADIVGRFVAPEDDCLSFDFRGVLENLEPNATISTKLAVKSKSFPTLTFTGLPSGLKYDSKALTVFGKVSKPGAYTVTVSGKNVSGYKYSQVFTISFRNIRTDRVVGKDRTAAVGTAVSYEISDLFDITGPRSSVQIAGATAGLKWNSSARTVSGTPNKEGTQTLTVTVKFTDGTTERATAQISVGPTAVPYEGIDLSCLENLTVGQRLDATAFEVGTQSNKIGMTGLSGLPTGLKLVNWKDEKGVKHYGVEGLSTKAGSFKLSGKVAYSGTDGKIKNATVTKTVVVAAAESSYMTVAVQDPATMPKCSVTGGGVVAAGSTVSLNAKAASKYVFAGWYDDAENPISAADGVDYRTASRKVPAQAGFPTEWYARFVAQNTDKTNGVAFCGLDGAAFLVSSEGTFAQDFRAVSLSLPSLTFRGLPTGFGCTYGHDDVYTLAYDARTAKSRPKPGLYPVTLTGVNRANATALAAFSIRIRNWTCAEIDVPDDYGTFRPGFAIEPIRLDQALKAPNATLSVSGLPRGLTYNAKAKKGVEAMTITGTPTVPGDYTITFTAKWKEGGAQKTAQATSSIRIDRFPKMTVVVENAEDIRDARNTATGGGSKIVGTQMTLTARAVAGSVFSCWLTNGVPVSQSASYKVKMPADDITYVAKFVSTATDKANISLSVGDLPFGKDDVASARVMCGVKMSWPVAATALSVPTVRVSGLPAGLTFKNNVISGAPTKGQVAAYPVKLTVITSGKSSRVFTVLLTVDPLPDSAVGTFNGVLYVGEVAYGTLSATATAAGRISSVKAVRPTGTHTFKADCWDAYDWDTGVLSVTFAKSSGATLRFALDTRSAWTDLSVSGVFTDAREPAEKGVLAQRNLFGTKGIAEANALAKACAGTYKFRVTENPERKEGDPESWILTETEGTADITISVRATGAVQIAGKIGKQSISGSSTLFVGHDETDGDFALVDFVKIMGLEHVLRLTFDFGENEFGYVASAVLVHTDGEDVR